MSEDSHDVGNVAAAGVLEFGGVSDAASFPRHRSIHFPMMAGNREVLGVEVEERADGWWARRIGSLWKGQWRGPMGSQTEALVS